MHYQHWNDSGALRIYQNDSLLVEFDVMEWFKQQIPLDTNLMEEAFEKNKKRLAFFDTGDIRVILSSLRYNKDTKKVDDVNIDFILIKSNNKAGNILPRGLYYSLIPYKIKTQ